MICDLCIVQLNVSYSFKRLAIESDSKMRQYIIEKGLQPLAITCDAPTPPPPPQQQQQQTSAIPTSIYYSSNISFTQNSTTRIFPKPLPLMATEIKQEPVELLSEEIVLEYDDSEVSTSPETVIIGQEHVTGKTTNTQTTPPTRSSFSNNFMVVVNDDTLLKKTTPTTTGDIDGSTTSSSPNSRDLEFVNNYMIRDTLTESPPEGTPVKKRKLQLGKKPKSAILINPVAREKSYSLRNHIEKKPQDAPKKRTRSTQVQLMMENNIIHYGQIEKTRRSRSVTTNNIGNNWGHPPPSAKMVKRSLSAPKKQSQLQNNVKSQNLDKSIQ